MDTNSLQTALQRLKDEYWRDYMFSDDMNAYDFAKENLQTYLETERQIRKFFEGLNIEEQNELHD
jgi:hypothetical protein